MPSIAALRLIIPVFVQVNFDMKVMLIKVSIGRYKQSQ